MAKKIKTTDDYDSPWKEALQRYLPAFLLFFYPDIHADIDWSRNYESLDKEFQQIARRAKIGKRLADKLFKVWLKDGGDMWLLIHIEIQGSYDATLPKRMFDYNVASYQLYNREVVSLAILCDDDPEWRPDEYGYGRWGSRTSLKFPVRKLLDYVAQAEAAEAAQAADNPFAIIVLVHVKAMETRRDPQQRRQWKLHFVKGLYRQKWSKEDVRQLFRLIDWIMTLPDELEEAFRNEVHEFDEEKKVRYITSIERLGFRDGLEKGLEKGRKQGLEKGREQGREQGRASGQRELLLELIAAELGDKFGGPGRKLAPKVRALDEVAKLRRFLQFLKKAATLEEVRVQLAPSEA